MFKFSHFIYTLKGGQQIFMNLDHFIFNTFNDTSNWREDHGIRHQLHYTRSCFIQFERKLLE